MQYLNGEKYVGAFGKNGKEGFGKNVLYKMEIDMKDLSLQIKEQVKEYIITLIKVNIEGDFLDGNYNGKGKYTWATGEVYGGF